MKTLAILLVTALLLAFLLPTGSVQAGAVPDGQPQIGTQATATPAVPSSAPEGPNSRGIAAAIIAFVVVIGLLFATRAVQKPKDR